MDTPITIGSVGPWGTYGAVTDTVEALVEAYYGSVNQSRATLRTITEECLGHPVSERANALDMLIMVAECGMTADRLTTLLGVTESHNPVEPPLGYKWAGPDETDLAVPISTTGACMCSLKGEHERGKCLDCGHDNHDSRVHCGVMQR